jgi:hypothetical protein
MRRAEEAVGGSSGPHAHRQAQTGTYLGHLLVTGHYVTTTVRTPCGPITTPKQQGGWAGLRRCGVAVLRGPDIAGRKSEHAAGSDDITTAVPTIYALLASSAATSPITQNRLQGVEVSFENGAPASGLSSPTKVVVVVVVRVLA